MKRRGLYFFIVPLFVILISLYFFHRFNRTQIKAQFEKITIAEGVTIRDLIEISGKHIMAEGEEKFKKFLSGLFENKLIVYLGLFKENELKFLLSRFEGYFPVFRDLEKFHIIDSPIGKIFDIKTIFTDTNGRSFKLHIGFNYEFLTTFENTAKQNFLTVAIIFLLLFLFIIGLIIYFDKKYYKKEIDYQREKQEKERFKELSLLTSEIAHEIKNPLNSIYLSFNALEDFIQSNEKNIIFYKDAIKGEIKRITEILHSYANLSKEIKPQLEVINIESFVKEFELIRGEELKKKNIGLKTHLEKNLNFRTDSRLLKQILLNLVKNSIEAGASLIELTIASDNRRLYITVKDNGKGISRKETRDIFKPYFSTKMKGMGLGLHIVLKNIKALNGDIELFSGLPGNTIFKIKIPGKE